MHIQKTIKKEIEEILKNKIEVPFFREGNFIKFKMPVGMENPQVFVNEIPFRYKNLKGMCYIEVEEGINPKKVEVCENIDIWTITEEIVNNTNIEEAIKKEKIENDIPDINIEDEYQREAVVTAYQNSFSLIFGPPGSGKTTVILELLNLLKFEKIAVLSLSNLAVDNVLDRIPENLREETIRVGNPFLESVKEMSASQRIKEKRKELRKRYLKALAYEIASSKLEYFYDAIREKEIEKAEIEKEIEKLIKSESEEELKKEIKKKIEIEEKIIKIKKELNNLSFLSFIKKKKLQNELMFLQDELENQKKYISALTEKINLEKEKFKEIKESQYNKLLEKKIAISQDIAKLQGKYEKYKIRAEKYKTAENPEHIKEEIDNLRKIERSLIAKARIIGTTIHTFLFRFRKFHFDTIIIDEVSQIPYPFIIALRKLCKRLVLLGDPQQLEPVTKSNIPNIFKFAKPDVVLRNVRRYPSEIGKLVNALYDEPLNCVRTGGKVEWIDIKGETKRDKGKIWNEEHINKIVEIAKDKKDVAVVTPFRYQAYLLRKKGIEAGTIHSFQGQERKEIIIDLTDPDSKFINKNMLIVALSRAKEKVTVIGDLEKALESPNKNIRKIAQIYKENFAYQSKKANIKIVKKIAS